MPAVMLPIGHFLGAFSIPRGPGQPEPTGVYGVRLGGTTVDLDEQEFGVWVLARGIVEEKQKAVSAASLRSLARRADLDDAQPTIEALSARGLLTKVLPVKASAQRFAQGHR
ncbi:MAG: hypothetical protein ACRDPW_07975, partial [Mycobacteriales bacterium]